MKTSTYRFMETMLKGSFLPWLPALILPGMYHTQTSIFALLRTTSILISKLIKKSNHKVTFYGVLCLIIQLFFNPTEENNYMENKDKYPPPNPITYCLHICDLCQKMSFPCKVILTSHPCDVGNLSFFQKVLVDFNSCLRTIT